MPLVYSCPVCGRSYSVDEYIEDRFCRNCDTLLRRTLQEKNEDVEGWRSLFPYTPYSQQIDFMNDIEKVVEKNGVLIAEACNGFGKTASCLASILPLNRSIIYATRTHEQVRQVLNEISTINEASSTQFTAVNLASRSHLCINPDCNELPRGDALELCRSLRETEDCPWDHEILSLPRGLPLVLTQRVLISIGRKKGICPYYLARSVVKRSKVVVVPYPYVFDKRVRSSVDLEVSGKILILDE